MPGTREIAEQLAEALGGTARLPGMDDHTINTGTVVFSSPTTGRPLLIDVLHHVHGLTPEEIRKLAVPIDLEGGSIYVLHPLLCIKSRVCNLADLAHKRTPEGRAQARVALEAADYPWGYGYGQLRRVVHLEYSTRAHSALG